VSSLLEREGRIDSHLLSSCLSESLGPLELSRVSLHSVEEVDGFEERLEEMSKRVAEPMEKGGSGRSEDTNANSFRTSANAITRERGRAGKG